jgi:hypothetical protein
LTRFAKKSTAPALNSQSQTISCSTHSALLSFLGLLIFVNLDIFLWLEDGRRTEDAATLDHGSAHRAATASAGRLVLVEDCGIACRRCEQVAHTGLAENVLTRSHQLGAIKGLVADATFLQLEKKKCD